MSGWNWIDFCYILVGSDLKFHFFSGCRIQGVICPEFHYCYFYSMKFSCILGNPPYDKNLHLKIINTVINHLTEDGTASFIHPARWYEDPLAEYKKGTDKVKFKNIVDRLDDVKIIDTKTANTKFDILSNSELMLSKLKQKPTGKNITVYNEIAQEAIDIILKYSLEQNLSNVDEKNKVDGWRCQILNVIPIGRPNDDSNRLISNDLFHGIKNVVFYDGYDENGIEWMKLRNKNQYTKESGSPFPHSIKFKSKEEALNFQKSCRTKFYNNIMYLFKLDMQTPLDFLPWMKDYSHTWTDEDYCKFFAKYGMSEECQKWMCRDVYDYRIKDFVDYEKFDGTSTPKTSKHKSKPIVDDEDEETQEELRRHNIFDRNNDEEDEA